MKGAAWDAVVVGGGPAGLSAGMYLARAGRRVLLVERARVGGRALGLERIENYPGFPAGIRGAELMRRFEGQARRWGLAMRRGRVLRIERRRDGLAVRCARGPVTARAALLCTGTRFVEVAQAPAGGGVGHAALERARLFRGREVAVLGGGEAAAHQALALARSARRVHLLHRGPVLKAIPLLRRRLAEASNVEVRAGCRVESLARGRGGLSLSLSGAEEPLKVAALFVLAGQEPDLSVLGGRPAPRGCFVAGDAAGAPRQVAAAAADGMRAAMECERYLEGLCAS